MQTIVGVRFKKAGKIYYFDPGNLSLAKEDPVIVETARGLEFGHVVIPARQMAETEVVTPLKPVLRKATEKDIAKVADNEAREAEALRICSQKIETHKLDMNLVSVEYTFDVSKIIFYFTAEGRVDFRELVKDLASVFKMRIELRQIGVRDEAKMMGGIGSCGKGLCCHTWLPDFEPVSIKMAKVQNLSLNPTKISGVCGRLMCCLKYENDIYLEMKKGMPDVGERIKTPNGMAVVLDSKILENSIKTRLILEERTDTKPEKLSTEFYFFKKQDIERLGAGKKNKKDRDKDLLAEIVVDDSVSRDELEKLLRE